MPRLAFVLAGSPNARFYSQFAALNAAIKAVPWTVWEPSIHVAMGARSPGGTPDDMFERWQPYLREVQFTYVSEARHEAEGNWAQVDTSLLSAPRDADAYVTLDADTLPVSDLEGVLAEVHRENTIAGVMAHFAPPAIGEIGGWNGLAQMMQLKPLELTQAYSLVPADAPVERRVAPAYFNGGVVFYSRASFDAFIQPYFALRHRIATRFAQASDFSGQLATAFALEACGMRVRVLPMRYNYPNDDLALSVQPGELDQVAVFHYLREAQFDRGQIFASAEAYRDFLEKPLSGVNVSFRKHVTRILGTAYPFP